MITNLILRALNWIFHTRGMELRALTPLESDASMRAGLRRAAALFPEIGTVVDVGAAAGKWTRLALPLFPRSRFLLVEPLAERVPELDALRREQACVEYVSAAASREPGEALLAVTPDLDGSGLRATASANTRTVAVTTLDGELSRRSLPAPYIIKLDTHGYEVPILEGAEKTLERTSLLIIEAYNFKIAPEGLRFHELCAWLEARGFRSIDLLEPLRRSQDQALWQMDLVFARADHPAFAKTSF